MGEGSGGRTGARGGEGGGRGGATPTNQPTLQSLESEEACMTEKEVEKGFGGGGGFAC